MTRPQGEFPSPPASVSSISLSDGERGFVRVFRFVCLGFLFLSVCLFAFNCRIMRLLKIDDAYITFRFASRLAREGTLRWNLLEAPVEGYTSFLAVLISAFFEWLGLDPLLCWKIFGVLLVLGGAGAAVWGAREFCAGFFPETNRSGLPFLAGALWCAHPAAAIHTMSGMETMLFAFLLIALAALAIHLIVRRPPKLGHAISGLRRRGFCFALFGTGLFLLGLTRPEGVLWAAFGGAGVWLGLPREERARFARAMLLFFILPGFIYFLARWAYFQSFLPSTFHAKAGSAQRSGAGRLATYLPSHHEVYKYFRDFWFRPGLAAVVILMVQGFQAYRRWGGALFTRSAMRGMPIFLLGAGSAVCIVFFAHVHLLMSYAHRFFYPFGQIFWLVFIFPGMAAAWQGIRKSGASLKSRALWAGLVLALMAGVIHAVWAGLVFSYGRWEPGSGGRLFSGRGAYTLIQGNTLAEKTGYRPVGKTLDAAALRAERRWTLFHHNMGELFYFAPHWDSIDPIGLVDAHVAKNGFHAGYVFDRNPDAFLLPSMKQDAITVYPAEFLPDVSRVLFLDSRMTDFEYLGYYPDMVFWSEGRMHLLVRRHLLEAFPWLRDYLTSGLDLRIAPGFEHRGSIGLEQEGFPGCAKRDF